LSDSGVQNARHFGTCFLYAQEKKPNVFDLFFTHNAFMFFTMNQEKVLENGFVIAQI